MNFTPSYISYHETGAFAKIIEDYLDGAPALKNYYQHRANVEGIRSAIEARQHYPYNRSLLVTELRKQYDAVETSDRVRSNIELLQRPNCFTITTAHQPNIFTGHLYFIYKILHAIKLSDELNDSMQAYHFVPVYYMGSEDADLEELGEVMINGKKYQWKTAQTGAVGRMKVDRLFIDLIEEIDNQLSVEKYGNEIMGFVKQAYAIGKTIESATFEFVNRLFADKGLLIFLPDNAALKNEFNAVNKKEISEQFSQKAVAETLASFPPEYKVQAAGRDVNLFYLKDDLRERIDLHKEGYAVANTATRFTREELYAELSQHPERFSPNVILRPVFQEMILPNVAFIGGGGEIAYWLELKKVFDLLGVPYPLLILRNSFMVVKNRLAETIKKLKLTPADFFKPERELVNDLVNRETALQLKLDEEKKELSTLYEQIRGVATKADPTLSKHVDALCLHALKRIMLLERKMLKAERKTFEASQRQLHKIKTALFPGESLQERVDNLLPYYAVYGSQFLQEIYFHSGGFEQQFCIMTEQ